MTERVCCATETFTPHTKACRFGSGVGRTSPLTTDYHSKRLANAIEKALALRAAGVPPARAPVLPLATDDDGAPRVDLSAYDNVIPITRNKGWRWHGKGPQEPQDAS